MSKYEREYYHYLRQHRPDLLRKCVETGLIITCALPTDDRLTMAAKVESQVVQIITALLQDK